MTKNKTNSAIVLLLMATMAFALIIPVAYAHDPFWKIISYAYITAAPNPVGVGQRVAIVM